MSVANTMNVNIVEASGVRHPGHIQVMAWNDQERRARAAKKPLRLFGTVFLCSMIGLVVHILLLVIIPGLILTGIGSIILFLKLWNEKETIVAADGFCPTCKSDQKMKPFLDAQIQSEMTLQCEHCGQNCKAVPA